MRHLLIALALASTSAPALAQHQGHGGHTGHGGAHTPTPRATPARPGPNRATPQRRTQRRATSPRRTVRPAARPAAPTPADPHAGHAMPQPDPHAGHQGHGEPAPATTDPHAGHDMTALPATDPHAGHDMGAPAAADPHAGHRATASPPPPVAPPPEAARSGPAHAADAIFGADVMTSPRTEMMRMHGRIVTQRLRIDRLEASFSDEGEAYVWDADFVIGPELDRLWLKTEGEGAFTGSVEHAEVQALWGHALDPWFDLQVGVRHDFRPDPQRTHLVVGVQGVAPYWFEVDAAAFLSDQGELTARVEAEYDLLITRRLVLQPRVEVEASAQDMPDLRTGSGLTHAEAGFRLRYEISRRFAPYVGVNWEQTFGGTAGYRRADGEDVGGFRLVAGVRAWF